jgi:methyl coenzyme M reductase gamma subunit
MAHKVGIWEWRQWRMRWGRFRGLDKDTRERTQIIPVPELPIEQQTHKKTDTLREIFDRAGGDDDS